MLPIAILTWVLAAASPAERVAAVLQKAMNVETRARAAAELAAKANRRPEAVESIVPLFRSYLRSPEYASRVLVPWLERIFTAAELKELETFAASRAGIKFIFAMEELDRLATLELRDEIAGVLVPGGESRPALLSAIRRTASDIRSIASAVLTYAVDHNRYPTGRTVADLEAQLVPKYIHNLPKVDAWGQPLQYAVSSDGRHFRIGSGGADQRLERANMTFGTGVAYGMDETSDLVFQNDSCLVAPPIFQTPGEGDVRPRANRKQTPAEALRVGGDVRPPVVIHRVNAAYSDEARKARIQGDVMVEAVIDESGAVVDANVIKPLPAGLDQAALDAVKQWRFRPATLAGKPVKVIFTVTVSFRLQEPVQ
ncbi:MAG TPA: TonB family protein [Thermoanaerobaculia bacterium]|nr:TonB family protein [Thermoanaerobaculia bacterium]